MRSFLPLCQTGSGAAHAPSTPQYFVLLWDNDRRLFPCNRYRTHGWYVQTFKCMAVYQNTTFEEYFCMRDLRTFKFFAHVPVCLCTVVRDFQEDATHCDDSLLRTTTHVKKGDMRGYLKSRALVEPLSKRLSILRTAACGIRYLICNPDLSRWLAVVHKCSAHGLCLSTEKSWAGQAVHAACSY